MKTILTLGGRGLNFANYLQTVQEGYDVYPVKAFSDLIKIRDELKNKQVHVVVGLGGTLGTVLVTEVTTALRENGIDFTLYVTLPFSFEGNKKLTKARQVAEQMVQSGYNVVIEDNNAILENMGAVNSVKEAFIAVDEALYERIKEY